MAPPVIAAPQRSPTLQVLPAQQGDPLVPQAAQVLLTQAAVADAQRPAQQGCPVIPHATQEPPTHALVALSQRVPPQHGSPVAPQVTI